MQLDTNRARGRGEEIGDLGRAEATDVAQHDDRPLLIGEPAELAEELDEQRLRTLRLELVGGEDARRRSSTSVGQETGCDPEGTTPDPRFDVSDPRTASYGLAERLGFGVACDLTIPGPGEEGTPQSVVCAPIGLLYPVITGDLHDRTGRDPGHFVNTGAEESPSPPVSLGAPGGSGADR